MRKLLLGLVLGLAIGGVAQAQAPSPADVGISKGVPDVFKLKGSDNVWTPFGSVDPSTHVFAPGTNGSIAPNDCLKWGPGITSAGMACGSGGGGGGGNQLTIYTSHSGLVNNVTTPTEAWTAQQQGFYAPGDGGAATYQWNFGSYCLGGTSGAPTTADGVVCVLPIGQSASTAGRYLLQVGGEVDVRQIGMQPGGQDNSPYVATLNALAGAVVNNTPGPVSVFPPQVGQTFAYWYFSQPFTTLQGGTIDCKGHVAEGYGASVLLFGPGISGVIQENSPGYGQNDIKRCTVFSLGGGRANNPTAGSTTITGIGLAPLVNAGYVTLPASCNPSAGECHVGVGDGVIYASQSQMLVAPGAYVSASDPVARTVTLASPYTVLPNTVAAIPAGFFDLPAAQKYTVQTTTGSNTIVVTAGPRPLREGDMLWSDAFLFGATAWRLDNVTSFPQTIQVSDVTVTSFPNALVTHGSGAPGQMWAVPAAIERRVQGSTHQDLTSFFPFGLRLTCSSGTVPTSGCNGSYDQENSYSWSLVGRLARGNNSGVSTAIGNVYAANWLADEIEAGTVGSSYFSEEDNSQDSGTAAYGTLMFCGINASVFYGSYVSGQPLDGACLGPDAQGNPSIVAPPAAGGPLFVGPIFGSPFPSIRAGEMGGGWAFDGHDHYTVQATAAIAAGATAIPGVPIKTATYAGMQITDTTNSVIPPGTTIATIGYPAFTISNALTGGGIQIGDNILITNPSSSTGGCFGLSGGVDMTFTASINCGAGTTFSYNGALGTWYFSGQEGSNMFLTDYGYIGYQSGANIVFPAGIEVGYQQGYFGQERLIDSGPAADTRQVAIRGNVRFNNNPHPGDNMAWSETTVATSVLSADVVAGTTTSVAVSTCPAVTVGDLITDEVPINGIGYTNVLLGTFASCATGTLHFQAAASNNGSNGDVISFLEARPAGLIAKDAQGIVAASAQVFVTQLPTCTPAIVGSAIVTDGPPVSSAGYGAAVTTGSDVHTRPVFCDGTSWTYH